MIYTHDDPILSPTLGHFILFRAKAHLVWEDNWDTDAINMLTEAQNSIIGEDSAAMASNAIYRWTRRFCEWEMEVEKC